MKRCVIFGSAKISDYSHIRPVEKEDIIISADGGLDCIFKLGVKPDYIVGDMDSFKGKIPSGLPIELYPSEKDDTDAFIAVKKGLELGCDSFILYGCLGGRLGHTLANLQLLIYLAKQGKQGTLINENHIIYAISNGSMEITTEIEGKVSIVSFSEQATGVTLEGFKYPLKNAVISNDYTIGVSNELLRKNGKITVKQGDLIVILEKDEKLL